MKRFLFFSMCLIFIGFQLSAQKSTDVLYLKNGSSIYGKLIEVSDNQYKIRTSDGSIFIYSSTEVEKFVNEVQVYEGRKKSGFGFALEGGFMFGAQSTEYFAPFTFNYIGSYTYNTKEIFGIGSGVEFIGQSFMPVFAEYKHLMSTRKTVPFIFIRGGRLLHLNGDGEGSDLIYNQYNTRKAYKGGPSFTFGTGISWSKNDVETYLSFAYRYSHTSYTETNYNQQNATYYNSLNRLEIKFGFKF